MTQVKSAQHTSVQVALRPGKDPRTLAQKRADLVAQVNAMALADLQEVSARLKALHKELERKDGRKWTQIDLADATGIPYRTLQSWETGQVENRGGKGYEKLARFYSRKLGRKITREWIVFGKEGLAVVPNIGVPMPANPGEPENDRLMKLELLLRQNQEKLDRILDLMIRRESELVEEDAAHIEKDEPPLREQEPGADGEAAP